MKLLPQLLTSILMLASLSSFAETLDVAIPGAVGNLAAIIQKPEIQAGEKVPMVIICHGFTGNKAERLLVAIADSLQSKGIASIRFDFDGHGQSDGDFQNMTVPLEVIDAQCVYNYAASLPYVSEIGMVGHSQGGVVTAMEAGNLGADKIKAVALLAPAAVLRDDALRGTIMGVNYDPHNVPDGIKIFGNRTLGRDYVLSAQTLPIYETARLYTGKALIIHGTYDVIVPYTYGQRFHYLWPDSEMILLPKADHGFRNNIKEVAAMVANFMKAQL